MKKQPSPKNKRMVTVVIIVAVLLALTIFGLFYDIRSSGQAAYTTAPLTPLEFTTDGEHSVDITAVPSFQLLFRPSAAVTPRTYDVTLTKNTDGSLTYSLQQGQSQLALGRLNAQLPSSGNIFLDHDFQPDLEFSYGGNLFRLRNLNFIRPETSVINLQELTGAAWGTASSKQIVYVPLNAESTFRIIISSAEAVPTATIAFADAVANTFLEVPTTATATSKTYELKLTPTVRKPYTATVTATVGGQTTTKTYLFAVDGLLYSLDQQNYPKVSLTLDATGNTQATVVFEPTLGLQPFSVPCSLSSPTISSNTDSTKLKALYAYKYVNDLPLVQSWINGATPQGITMFEPNYGYALKLNTAEVYKATFNCNSYSQTQPALHLGWNYISLTGYQSLPASSLIVPPTKHISTTYLLKKDQAYEAATELEPGKAYWVLVE